MAQLNLHSSDRASVPGQDVADKEAERQRAQASASANLPFKSDPRQRDVGPDYTYSKIRLHKKEEVNVYAAEQDARYATDPRLKKIIAIGVACLVAFPLVCMMPTQYFNRSQFGLAIWLSEFVAGFQSFVGVFVNPDSPYATHVFTVLVTLLAGGAMALSGGIFQGSLKNVLASPSTLGVTNGGSIGAIIYAVFIYPTSLTANYSGSSSELIAILESPTEQFISTFGGFICSLIGCATIVTLVMAIAIIAGRGKVSNVALVVAGQVFASTITLILSFIRTWLNNHGDTETATYLAQSQTMTFTGAYTLGNVLVFAIPLLICIVICLLMSSRMSLLAFNEDEARSMGISTTRMRFVMVALCTIMTALVVSFCGMVGFVGLICPYIARKLIGPDFRYFLPACLLIGALLMMVTFYITQIGFPYLVNGSSGVLTSVIGSVTFFIIAVKERRSSGGDWI